MRRFPSPCPQVTPRHHYHKRPTTLTCRLLKIQQLNSSPSAMDWCSWLSKSNLHPILAQEYGLLFSRNELEEDDIEHLDHELLLSMGISVGKHRLEILKLARRERKGITAAMKKFSKRAAEYVQRMARGSSSAIVAVPKAAGGRWRGGTVRSSRRLLTAKPCRLMITNGSTAAHDSSQEGSGAIAEVKWDSMFQDLNPT